MKPDRKDVFAMAVALMAVVSSVRRASQKGDAATLSILGLVASRPRVRPSDVAIELGVNQSSVTRQMQKFERLGFLKLVADPIDRRSCHIVLTAAGLSEVRRLSSVGLDRFALFVKDWDSRDVRAFTRYLAQFERSKSAANSAPPRAYATSWRVGASVPARKKS
jgi:DNA-binding MarR family transcriptional regulator